MSSFWNFMFGAILVLIWIIAGGYITQANVFLGPYSNTDPDLHLAYRYSFWAAFVTWFLIAIFILLIILSVIGVVALFGSGVGEAGVAAEGAEAAETESTFSQSARNYANSPDGQSNITTGISWFTIAFLVFALILVGITGVLSALTATAIARSPNYNPSIPKLKTAYNNSIIAASMCLGAAGLLIIGIITYFIIGIHRQRIIDAQNQYVDQRRQLELSEIKQLKQQAVRQKVIQQAEFKQELMQAERQAILNRIAQQAVATPTTVTPIAAVST